MQYIPDEDNLADEDIEMIENQEASSADDKAMAATEDIDLNSYSDDLNEDDAFEIIDAANEDISIRDAGQGQLYSGLDEFEPDSYDSDDGEISDSELAQDGCLDDEPLDLTNASPARGKARKRSLARSLLYDLIFYAILIFACIYIIPNFVLQRTIVDGSSMEDTLMDREQLYVEKISYHFNALKRFDIIVFYPYGRENEDYYVKRIIGLPGEKVQIIGSNIYINDELLEEHYGKEPIKDPGRAASPIYLGEDEYFVMGDNRNRSKDSRNEQVGNVKKENIGGRVILRIYPFDRFGFVD